MRYQKIHSHADHPAPVTRRQFLGQGLIAGSATFLLTSRVARAAVTCEQADSRGSSMPFLVFDMAGGAALPGNFLVGGTGGPEDLLPNYDRLGWNPKASGAYDKRFGLPMAAKQVSQLFVGITQTASADAQNKLRLGSLCHRAQDDSPLNAFSAIDLVMSSGYRGGSVISQALGTRNSYSGGNSASSSGDPSFTPLFIDQVDALAGALKAQGYTDVPAPTVPVISDGIRRLGLLQGPLFSTDAQAEMIEKLGACLFGRLSLDGDASKADPRLNPVFQSIYGLQPNTPALNPEAVTATVVAAVLTGFSGPGVITLGGCDYHTGSSREGDAKDLEMGRQIGRAVQAAHVLGRPLVFQLLTDGGVFSDPGTRDWRSDAGDKCLTVVGHYNPRGTPKQVSLQVGHYTTGQGAALDTLIGAAPISVAHAVLLNYLNINGRLGDYASIVDKPQFSPGDYEKVLLFDQGVA